jgi:hypothetical protein
VPSRRARISAFGRDGTRDGGREPGMEELTTDKAGSKGLEAAESAASQDADDLLRTGGVDSGTGASVGGSMDAVDRISVPSGGRDNVAAGGMS